MYFWSYQLPKTFLDKYLKSVLSEDPLTTNMVDGLKNWSELNDSTFTIVVDSCESNSE